MVFRVFRFYVFWGKVCFGLKILGLRVLGLEFLGFLGIRVVKGFRFSGFRVFKGT